jgi:hypothetical protein
MSVPPVRHVDVVALWLGPCLLYFEVFLIKLSPIVHGGGSSLNTLLPRTSTVASASVGLARFSEEFLGQYGFVREHGRARSPVRLHRQHPLPRMVRMKSSLLGGVAGADLLEVLALCDSGRNVMTIRYSPCHAEDPRQEWGGEAAPPSSSRSSSERQDEAADPFACAQVARLLGVEASGFAQVRLEGSRSHMIARNASGLGNLELQLAARIRRRVVVVFENGDPSKPMIVGVLTGPISDAGWGPDTGEFLATEPQLAKPVPVPEEEAEAPQELRANADDEVVIECGHASISVRRSGRVVIQGTSCSRPQSAKQVAS